MKMLARAVAAAAATLLIGAGVAAAQDRKSVEPPDGHPLSEIISGFEFRTPETQKFQIDDFENPGFLWLEQGEALWETADGEAGKSCADCHGDATESMKGVKAVYPKWHEDKNRPLTLEQRINTCRVENMRAGEWGWESDEMLGMTAMIGAQSRGMPVNVQQDGPMAEWHEKGKELYYTRVGQLDMSCAHCHEDNYGNYIRADMLSQGQSNGFPTYRFKWQKLGSLHRRFVGCMRNIRGVPYKRGSDEYVALEIYLAYRGIGLPVESPSVRN